MDVRALVVGAALASAQVSFAQVVGETTSTGCIKTVEADAAVSVEGRLVTATFTDDYGEERAYLLEIPKPTCIDDGGDFADRSVAFAQVQVVATNILIERALRESVGRRIKASGKAFAAHTRHHRRPMVVLVDRVIPLGRPALDISGLSGQWAIRRAFFGNPEGVQAYSTEQLRALVGNKLLISQQSAGWAVSHGKGVLREHAWLMARCSDPTVKSQKGGYFDIVCDGNETFGPGSGSVTMLPNGDLRLAWWDGVILDLRRTE